MVENLKEKIEDRLAEIENICDRLYDEEADCDPNNDPTDIRALVDDIRKLLEELK